MYPTRAARMLVKGAAAPCSSWCRCRVLLQGAAVKVARALWNRHIGAIAGCRSRCCCRFFSKAAGAHKTQVLILQMYQGSELGSLRYGSGMIRGMTRKPIFLNSGSFVA